MLVHAIFVEIADLKRLREILAQVVGSSGLQSLAVAHHGFDGESLVSPRKALGVRFAAWNHRDCGFAHGKIRIDVEHLARLEISLFKRRVRGMPLLPEKFQRAEK